MQKKMGGAIVEIVAPALIMIMTGSLAFFLIELFYYGSYTGRVKWVIGLFVFATVLVSRLSIMESAGKAIGYGFILACATVLVLALIGNVNPLLGVLLVAVVIYVNNKLTWDCTVIDHTKDSTDRGLLERIGLDSDVESESDEDEEEDTNRKNDGQERSENGPETSSWTTRFFSKKKPPNTPGVWVIYMALAAFPIYGLGQGFITEEIRRQNAFFDFCLYLVGALGLLVTTAMLGLQRYLIRRKASMPNNVAITWVATGVVMIAAILIAAWILPRPYAEYAYAENPFKFEQKSWWGSSKNPVGSEGKKEGGSGGNKNEKSESRGGNSKQKGNSSQKSSRRSKADSNSKSGSQTSGKQSGGKKSQGSKSQGSKSQGSKSQGSKSQGSKSQGSKSQGSHREANHNPILRSRNHLVQSQATAKIKTANPSRSKGNRDRRTVRRIRKANRKNQAFKINRVKNRKRKAARTRSKIRKITIQKVTSRKAILLNNKARVAETRVQDHQVVESHQKTTQNPRSQMEIIPILHLASRPRRRCPCLLFRAYFGSSKFCFGSLSQSRFCISPGGIARSCIRVGCNSWKTFVTFGPAYSGGKNERRNRGKTETMRKPHRLNRQSHSPLFPIRFLAVKLPQCHMLN